MSLFSYFWNSEVHLNTLIFWTELCGSIIEVLVAAAFLGTFKKEVTEEIKKQREHRIELFALVAAVILPFVVVCSHRLGTLQDKRIEAALSTVESKTRTTEYKLEHSDADNVTKMEKLEQYFSNQWQQSMIQLSDAQKALAEVKSATMPRRITPEQREKFIKILLEHNNHSSLTSATGGVRRRKWLIQRATNSKVATTSAQVS